jgi:sterol 24-C-methyltransferase
MEAEKVGFPRSTLGRAFQRGVASERVREAVGHYTRTFNAPASLGASDAAALARDYYELVTDFYEYGWGQSFHFAPRRNRESVRRSLERCEKQLAWSLGLSAGMTVIDVGSGVGGPMRTIAAFSGARIVGICISPYQIERARTHNKRAGLEGRCEVVEGDFASMPFGDATFDAAYTLEACCHAADRRGAFGEVFRVLKPGAFFAGHDWCMTARYRPSDLVQERIKHDIEKGSGVATLVASSELVSALSDVGFDVRVARDAADSPDCDEPWYAPLAAGLSLRGFRNSRAGAFLTHQLVRGLEALGLSPVGTVQVHDVLRAAQHALVEGGRAGIFTPMFAWVARKPV